MQQRRRWYKRCRGFYRQSVANFCFEISLHPAFSATTGPFPSNGNSASGYWVRIPLIPATDSGGRRPPIPEQGGRFLSERSDAGFFQFSKSFF
jgi:hypothetical protein